MHASRARHVIIIRSGVEAPLHPIDRVYTKKNGAFPGDVCRLPMQKSCVLFPIGAFLGKLGLFLVASAFFL